MESNHHSDSDHSQPEDEDRLSMLTDDILLSILGKVSVRTAVRTSVLSTRWRHLPLLLPELSIDVDDFLSDPDSEPVEANDMKEAMVSLTEATRSFLSESRKGFTISRLHLTLYLIETFLCDIAPLVGDAIGRGLLKDLDLAILDETDFLDASEQDMLQRAQEIEGVFIAYPSVLHCLTKLTLRNVGFENLDMHHVLFDCCKQLKHLSLCHCDTGPSSFFKIDAPNSRVSVLELKTCRFERLDVVCLPKLEKLTWNTWVSHYAPLAFGFLPSLGELELSCAAICDQYEFKLSELLHGATGIHTLTLDFQGENLWMQPEMKQLCPAFNKLRKLAVRGIFVEFNILWTTAFLVAAPTIEILHIDVWEHVCDLEHEEFRRENSTERRTPQWEMEFDDSKNWLLKELEFVGFRSLEQQYTFIRSILQRSPNLQKIVLKGYEQCCWGLPTCRR